MDAFKPLADLIVVESANQETETSTGIALAGLEEEEGNSGAVVAVGEGRYTNNGELVAPAIVPGDSIMYTRRAGCEVTVEGKKYVIVSEADCLVKW